jgi:hypothetical protein
MTILKSRSRISAAQIVTEIVGAASRRDVTV